MGLFDKLFSRKQPKAEIYDSTAAKYQMSTLGQIEVIPVPTEEFEYNCDFKESIEYVLQLKASQFKKDKKMDCAIACLRKSNEIMPFAKIDYPKKTYNRLPEFLKQVGKFEEARIEELKIENMFKSDDVTTKSLQRATMMNPSSCDSDEAPLIVVSRECNICGECAKYHDRIYSVDGKDTRFLDMKLLNEYLSRKKCNCSLFCFPFTYGISIFRSSEDPIAYSNRPFEDDRTESEIEIYESKLSARLEEQKDRGDYDWIRENLPDIAPKSFGGYRNMKNKNSVNYQKIVSSAKEKGFEI